MTSPTLPPEADPDRPPLHGFRGDDDPAAPLARPKGLVVAVTREAGARGGSIARRVGRRLGWQVFDAETLARLARDDLARTELLADVPADAKAWADAQLARLARDRGLDAGSEAAATVRLVLTLAARGEAVLVGRAAGFLLPPETTVHARVVAPLAQRTAYFAQWLRLTHAEAAAEVAARDRRRAGLRESLSRRDPADPAGYDLVLNSGRLGEAAVADLIVQAVRAKQLAAADTDFEVD